MHTLGVIALVIVLVATVVWFRRAIRVAISPNRKPFAIAWGAGAALGALAWAGGGGAASVWATILGALFFYLVNTGAQRLGNRAVRVGDTLPAFTAVDDRGEPFDSAELAGTAVLIKFFRGHW